MPPNPYTPLLGRVARLGIGLLTFFAIAGIVAADMLTGSAYSLAILYSIPVGVSTWYLGRYSGLGFAVLSTAAVLLERFAGSLQPIQFAPLVWQGIVHFIYMIMLIWLVHSIRTILEKQEKYAGLDPLTGLLNRRAFNDRLDYVLKLAARERIPISIAYVDLDNFKRVNDMHGHEAGDRVLKNVASAMALSIRSSDVVSRLGGDEFVLLLPDTDGSHAQHLLYKLQHILENSLATGRTTVTCSVGCITFLTPPPDAESAIRAGDLLMYEAKRNGKNKISFQELR